MGGIFNIIVGLIMVGAGLSGQFSLLGTKSPTLLVAVGALVTAFGIYRTIRSRKTNSGD